MELSDEQKQDEYKKSLTKKTCPNCNFTYQSSEDVGSLIAAAKKVDRELYNMLFLDVFCENRFKPAGGRDQTNPVTGTKCSFQHNVNWFGLDEFEIPSKCPECGGNLLGTALLMKVSIGGIVESFCVNCLEKFSQSQPFKTV